MVANIEKQSVKEQSMKDRPENFSAPQTGAAAKTGGRIIPGQPGHRKEARNENTHFI